MVTFGAAVDGGEDDDFLDQQPDQGDDVFMSDDDDDFLHQQTAQADHDDDDDDEYGSDDNDDDDDDDDIWSDADDDFGSAQGDDDYFMSNEEEDPIPVQAPPASISESEAAIAALEAAEAPADDCCPVCLQDGGGEAPEAAAARAWSRMAPCGHRFHAACVDKWLRVKLSCPVCRCPAAPAAARRRVATAPEPPRRPIPGIVEEFLAVGFEESFAFDKTPRWNQYMDDPYRHIDWDST